MFRVLAGMQLAGIGVPICQILAGARPQFIELAGTKGLVVETPVYRIAGAGFLDDKPVQWLAC